MMAKASVDGAVIRWLAKVGLDESGENFGKRTKREKFLQY